MQQLETNHRSDQHTRDNRGTTKKLLEHERLVSP
jgi:hypothetical protein